MKTEIKLTVLAILLPICLLTKAQEEMRDTLFTQRNVCGKIEYARFKEVESDNRKLKNDTIFLKSILKTKKEDGFCLVSETTDDLGVTYKKFQQYYKGIQVDNAEYLLHGRNGIIEVISGNFHEINIETTTPTINERQAMEKALEYVGAIKYKWEDEAMEVFVKQHSDNPNATYYPKGELVIAEDNLKENGAFKLAWKFIVSSLEPYNEQMIFVDAIKGEAVRVIPLMLKSNIAGTAETR